MCHEFSEGKTVDRAKERLLPSRPSLISDDFVQTTEESIHADQQLTVRELNKMVPEVSLSVIKICDCWVPKC